MHKYFIKNTVQLQNDKSQFTLFLFSRLYQIKCKFCFQNNQNYFMVRIYFDHKYPWLNQHYYKWFSNIKHLSPFLCKIFFRILIQGLVLWKKETTTFSSDFYNMWKNVPSRDKLQRIEVNKIPFYHTTQYQCERTEVYGISNPSSKFNKTIWWVGLQGEMLRERKNEGEWAPRYSQVLESHQSTQQAINTLNQFLFQPLKASATWS